MSVIGKIFASIWKAIERAFLRLSRDHRMILKVTQSVVENIKIIAESPAIDVLTRLIPGGVDDHIKMLLRIWLPRLLFALTYINEQDYESEDEALVAAAKKLNGNTMEARYILRHGIAAMLTHKATEEQIPWSEATGFQEYHKKMETV